MIFIMIFAFLASLSYCADSYTKTICICTDDCDKSESRCTGRNFLDPRSPTFPEDFDAERKTIRDIEIVINQDRKGIDLTFHMNMLIGLNITFRASSIKANIDFIYDSDKDYSSCYFNIMGYKSKIYFKQNNGDSTKPDLILGTLIADVDVIEFEKFTNQKLSLSYGSVSIPISSLANFTSIKQTKNGDQKFLLYKDDVVSLDFGKSECDITYMGSTIKYNYLSKSSIIFKGPFRYNVLPDTLILKIRDGVVFNDLPNISLFKISHIMLEEKFWKPADENQYINIIDGYHIDTKSTDIPLNIFSDNVFLSYKAGSSFYGKISKSPSSSINKVCKLTVNPLESKKVSKITFLDAIDAFINLTSPYVVADIKNYTLINVMEEGDFPITFATDGSMISTANIENTVFAYTAPMKFYKFTFLVKLEDMYSDDEIKNLNILKSHFIELPAKSIEDRSYQFIIDESSSSNKVGVPGFVRSDPCLGVKYEIANNRKRISLEVIKSAYDRPRYICFGDMRCDRPPGMRYTDPDPYFTIAYDPDKGVDFKPMIPKNFKTIVIGVEHHDTKVMLDFTTLDPSMNDLDIQIYGESSRSEDTIVGIKINQNQVKNLTIMKATLYDIGTGLKTPNLQLFKVKFDNDLKLSFEKDSNLSCDIATIGWINSLNSRSYPTKTNVVMENEYYGYGIELYGDKWTLCKLNYRKDCIGTDLSYQSVNDLNIVTYSKTILFLKSTKSASMKGFNISSKSNDEITFQETGWEKVSFEPKIFINHDTIPLTVKLTQLNQVDDVVFTGDSSVDFKIEYSRRESVCVTSDSAADSCKDVYTPVPYSKKNLSGALDALRKTRMEIYFEQNPSIVVNFSIFDQKYVTIQNYQSDSNVYVINFDVLKIDKVYSRTIFDSITLKTEAKSPVSAQFGQLELTGVKYDPSWKANVGISVVKLTCTYSDLVNFRDITITDQLTVSGDLPTEKVRINFINDFDSNDFVSDINTNITIKILRDHFEMNNLICFMTQSNEYDILLNVKSEITVTFDVSPDVLITDIPRFNIDSSSFNIKVVFVNSWPKQMSGLPIINIISAKEIDVTLNGYAPVSLNKHSVANIHLGDRDSGIYGPIEHNSFFGSKFTNNYIDTKLTEPCTFTIDNGIHLNTALSFALEVITCVNTSNIVLNIDKITYNENSVTKANVTFINTVSKEGTSTTVIREKVPEIINIDSTFPIISLVTGKIDDEKEFGLFKKTNVILRVNTESVKFMSQTLEYVKDNSVADRSHGFYISSNCLGVGVTDPTEGHKDIVLVRESWPSEIPYTIDIFPGDDEGIGELAIKAGNKDDLNKLNQFLPSKISSVFINIYSDMTDSLLDFGQFSGGNIQVAAPGNTQRVALLSLPNNGNLNVSLSNLIITFTGSSLSVHSIEFNDCIFSNPSSFSINDANVRHLVVDVDSLNNLVNSKVLTSFTNKMVVKSATYVTFFSDGWEFRENKIKSSTHIKASSFTGVSFETTKSLTLLVGDSTIKRVAGLSMSAFPAQDKIVYITYGRGWQNIKDNRDLKINTNEAKRVHITTSSYPIVGVFDTNNVDISLETDDEEKFDPVKFEDGFLISNRVIEFDMNPLPPQYRFIYGQRMIFEGQSGLTLVDGVGELQVEELSVKRDSNATFSSVSIKNWMNLEENSVVSGDFNFDRTATVSFKWSIESHSKILFSKHVSNFPRNMIIEYDHPDVDTNKYNDVMLNGNGIVLIEGDFDCSSAVRGNIKFVSGFKYFDDESRLVAVKCDSSSSGNVLVLYGLTGLPDDSSSDSKSGNKSALSPGGTAGVVIGCVVVVALVVAFIIYVKMKRKVDILKGRVPKDEDSDFAINRQENTIETNDVYDSDNNESNQSA